MAGSKSKNNPAMRSTQRQPLGERIKYIGLLGAKFTCPVCGVQKKSAMIIRYENELYCSEYCIEEMKRRGGSGTSD